MEKENTLASYNSVCTKNQKTKEERTSAVRQLFHYSECKIIRYYTNHSDGLPAKNCVDYTVDTLVSTTYVTGVSTATSGR